MATFEDDGYSAFQEITRDGFVETAEDAYYDGTSQVTSPAGKIIRSHSPPSPG